MTGMAVERDFRKLAPATQAELRRIAVAMVRGGKTRIEAAEAVGVNRRFVGRWVKAAAHFGEAVLAGRIASPGMLLEAEPLPHLICSRPMFIGGVKDEADQHGGTRRVGSGDSGAVFA